MGRGQDLIDQARKITPAENLKSAGLPNNGHWVICDSCMVANLHDSLFCGMCGGAIIRAPHTCTPECRATSSPRA